MAWLAASLISCALFVAAALGTFVPLTDSSGVQYLYVWPGALKLALGSIAFGLPIVVLYVAVVRGIRRRDPEHMTEAQAGRWLAPFTALGVVVIGILPAAPGMGEHVAFTGYFFYDLRWWWLGVLALLVLIRIERLAGRPIERRFASFDGWSLPARLLFLDAVLFVLVTACVAATTRYLRFDPGIVGDEPKYMRYCEVWYQGRGLEVSSRKPFRDLPLDGESAVLGNVVLLGRAVREETASLVQDVGAFVSDPGGFQWNRARRLEGFVEGKRGGIYQIYLPGFSAFLFPAYFVDRHVLALRPTQEGEFPAELVMTNFAVLFLFGLCGVALFRLLRHALGSDSLAFLWAAVGVLTLPTAAFAFQFYPELAALLLTILVTTYVWFHASQSGTLMAAAAGAATAGLIWLHPRFLPLSMCLALPAILRTSSRRSRLALVAAAGFVYFTEMAFAYRVTGSWVPTALWDAPGGEPTLSPGAVPIGLLGYALHRTWGMAAQTPLLLAALPGLAILARLSSARAIYLAVACLALAAPAAAHTLNAAGTTPGRLIVAIVPLLIWPVAIAVRRFWSSAAVRALTIVAVVVSLESAITYDWNHIKTMGPMRSAGLSGWRLNLAFPIVAGGGWSDSGLNVLLLLLILSVLGGATIAAFVRARPTDGANAAPGFWPTGVVTVALVVLLSGAATAFNRDWTNWEYFVEPGKAQRAATEALVGHDRCRVCFGTRARAIDWRSLKPNPTDGVNIEVEVNALEAEAGVRVVLAGGDGGLRFGRFRADFGDGTETSWTGVVEEARLVHQYKHPGTYTVVVWLQLRNGDMRADRRTLTLAGSR
jgi:hypothetical protein